MVITTIDKMKCKLILRFEFQEECMEETIVEESINEEETEEIAKDKEDISKKEGKEGTSKEDCMEGIFNVEGIEETEGVVIKKEDIKETIQETQRITQYDHVDGENEEEENENPYIRLMTSPLILEGLLLKNQEDNTKKSSKESKMPRDDVGTLSKFLSADKKKKGKEQKNQEKKAKKERRVMLLFFQLFGR
ncbi:nucleolar protein 58-like [Ostrea edulis]|uniref:nucleolar protein 58-like n=1 Tax=Ostrea edulis TaxID=37623 RepID=UPI0024AEE425|nr:nucleolar protein 58-like [Ostrea edulis]